MPGPKAGSEGAKRISEAHKGSHDHDKNSGFAANPGLAQEAGAKGGNSVKERYGAEHYHAIGKKGGNIVKEKYGSDYYKEIGRRGGAARRKKVDVPATSS